MRKTSSIKHITITALCIALCYVLPIVFHATGLGSAFSPMHIPVLLCGLICGGGYGIFCGIAGPILSSVITGMPPATMLFYFIPELATYGLVTGLMMKLVRTQKPLADVYISLVAAMLLGRLVGGVAQALFYLGTGQAFTIAAMTAGYFVTTLPGIVCHLIVIPILVTTLMKAQLIPNRY